jgi:alpha-glucosidase (family GH31 glycosyl hydrolase)
MRCDPLTQWGVLLSHPRVHGLGEREPCRWPEPARRVVGDWIRLRYRLLPYILAEAGQAVAAGWWTRERVRGPRWVAAEHGLDTMPLYVREGAVIAMGPDRRWVGERPTDPLSMLVAPYERRGRTELRLPLDGREVAVRYAADGGRHRVEVDGHPGRVVLDAPPGVELAR